MHEDLPMTLTVLCLGIVAVIAFWYWLRIKSKQTEQAKADIHHVDREPIFLDPAEKSAVSTGTSTAFDSHPSQSSLAEEVHAQASPTEMEQEGYGPSEAASDFSEENPSVPTSTSRIGAEPETPIKPAANPYSELMDKLPFHEAMRFEETAKTGMPAHNPDLEEVFTVAFKTPVSGTLLVKELKDIQKIELNGDYSIYAWDTTEGKWELPDPIGSYSAVIIIVKLASTKGSLSSTAISQLIQFKQRLEMMLDGTSEPVDDQHIQKKAMNLSNWVHLFNRTFVLYLYCQKPISSQEFEAKASSLGFNRIDASTYEKLGTLVQSKDGKRYENRKGELVLSHFQPNVLKLELKVALVPPEREPLKLLMMAANAFAAVFGAQILCGDGSEVNGQLLAGTKKETDNFYAKMRMQGLEPGGENAFLLLT